ncbi:MAG TPA: hypothetical protein VIW28_12580 [Gemmatimonadales bacterium]|jgi:hypothetical protein
MVAQNTLRFLAAGAALLASACGDSTAPLPQLSNPPQLAADLQTVAAVLQVPAFQSFGALDSVPGSPLESAPAGALLAAARVAPFAQAPARLRAMKRAASALSSVSTAGVIPPDIQGKTFVWDASAHHYVVGADAGPSNGIRITLYAIDPVTRQVVESPLAAVGYLDLLDTSAGTTNRVEVIVTGGTPSSPGTTYADYTISATVTGSPATAFSASAAGYVSDGTRQLDFQVTFSTTNLDTDNPDGQFDATWSLNSPAVGVVFHDAVTTSDADHATLTIDFSVTRGNETVRLAGTVVLVRTPYSVALDLTVYVNGQTFARYTGTATGTSNNTRIRHVDGSELSAAELDAVYYLIALPAALEDAVARLFHPAESLMGA